MTRSDVSHRAHAASRTSGSSSCRSRITSTSLRTCDVSSIRASARATPSLEARGASSLAHASNIHKHGSRVSGCTARPSSGRSASRSGTCSVERHRVSSACASSDACSISSTCAACVRAWRGICASHNTSSSMLTTSCWSHGIRAISSGSADSMPIIMARSGP